MTKHEPEPSSLFKKPQTKTKVNLNWVKTQSQPIPELLSADLNWAELVQTFVHYQSMATEKINNLNLLNLDYIVFEQLQFGIELYRFLHLRN